LGRSIHTNRKYKKDALGSSTTDHHTGIDRVIVAIGPTTSMLACTAIDRPISATVTPVDEVGWLYREFQWAY